MKKFFYLCFILYFLTSCRSFKTTGEDIKRSSSEHEEKQRVEMTWNSEDSISGLRSDYVITIHTMHFVTEHFDQSHRKMLEIMQKYQGDIETSDVISERLMKSGSFTIRIPKDQATDFEKEMRTIGRVQSETIEKSNEINVNRDLQTRLNALEEKYQRLGDLMKKADNIDAVLKIEKEREDTIEEMDVLKSQIQELDHLTQHVTYDVVLKEVDSIEDLKGSHSFRSMISSAFKNSWKNIGNLLKYLVVYLVYFIPYLFLLGGLIFVGNRVIPIFKKKCPFKISVKESKREKKEE